MASVDTLTVTGSATQAFSYIAGVPVGFLQGISYGTLIGPLALQGFSYDLVQIRFAATLLEDSDGIVPAGSGTCDVTPTIQWQTPSGTPPFLYTWTLNSNAGSGGVVASGTTVNLNVATMPTLTPGIYLLNLVAKDGNGGAVGMTPLLFQVNDCKFENPPNVTIISPFDIEPVVPSDEDYIRYLPQWMSVHGTATAPPSASTTFQFLKPLLQDLRKIGKTILDVGGEFGVKTVPVDLPRKAWHLQTRFTSRDVISIVCTASGEVNNVRRETSVYNFLTALDPVYIMGDSGHILFRNLAQRTVTVAPVSGSTGATGSTLQILSTQYQMPFEHNGMVADADVLFFFNGIEYKIRAGSAGVDPIQAVVQLTAPFSGNIQFIYQSQTLAPVVTVSISGNPTLSPSPTDLWNRFDELGLVSGLQRRVDEDNLTFQKRIYSRFISGLGVDTKIVAQHIAQDLTLTDVIPWDGVSTLQLADNEILGVKYFFVDKLPQTDYMSEQLVRYGSNPAIYSGSKSNWLPGWQVFVDGRVATLAKYPSMVVSGNTVNFGTNVSGIVTTNYAYQNYTYTLSDQNTILTVTPVASNPISGSYVAIASRVVQLHTPADPDYMKSSLLNPDGTPNAFFYEIATRLLETSPIHFGRARWGPGAYWLARNENQPLTKHLPSIFDIITGY